MQLAGFTFGGITPTKLGQPPMRLLKQDTSAAKHCTQIDKEDGDVTMQHQEPRVTRSKQRPGWNDDFAFARPEPVGSKSTIKPTTSKSTTATPTKGKKMPLSASTITTPHPRHVNGPVNQLRGSSFKDRLLASESSKNTTESADKDASMLLKHNEQIKQLKKELEESKSKISELGKMCWFGVYLIVGH